MGTKLVVLVPVVGLVVGDVWGSTGSPVRGTLFSLLSVGALALIVASIVLDIRAGGSQLPAQDRLRRARGTDGSDDTLRDIEELMGGQPVARQSEQPEVAPSAAEAARRRLWK